MIDKATSAFGSAPVEGRLGRLWRAVSLPSRLAAPFVMLLQRRLRRSWWIESELETDAPTPQVAMTSGADDLQPPRDGAGLLNVRRYHAAITGAALTPNALMDELQRDPNQFSPTAFATFVPQDGDSGFDEGNKLTVSLPGPWNGPVVVSSCDERHVRLETLEGHIEAGWIEFRATGQAPRIDFTIESAARSGDAVFDVIYSRLGIGKLIQTEMWVQVLEAAADVSGGSILGRCNVTTISYSGTTAARRTP